MLFTVLLCSALLCSSSVNEVICHGIPDLRPLEDGDIVNSMRVYHACFITCFLLLSSYSSALLSTQIQTLSLPFSSSPIPQMEPGLTLPGRCGPPDISYRSCYSAKCSSWLFTPFALSACYDSCDSNIDLSLHTTFYGTTAVHIFYSRTCHFPLA